jgi:virulence factor
VRERLTVGVIGLGDIARKAYLPVLAARPDLTLHLCTRDRAALDEIGDAYRVARRTTDLAELLSSDIDAAFVHAATSAHARIVTALLDSGRHVYVDKPLDDSASGARRLARLAELHRRSLMVGFNRRFAPVYTALSGRPRDLVVMQKNRRFSPAEPRQVIFDDFIHVVDTLRFLTPGPVDRTQVNTRVERGLLHHVVLELSGPGFTALGLMNRAGPAAEERIEVMGGGQKRTVLDLATVEDSGEPARTSRRGDWTPVSRQRGIEQACEAFLTAVRDGQVLDTSDAMATHDLCERIVAAAAG